MTAVLNSRSMSATASGSVTRLASLICGDIRTPWSDAPAGRSGRWPLSMDIERPFGKGLYPRADKSGVDNDVSVTDNLSWISPAGQLNGASRPTHLRALGFWGSGQLTAAGQSMFDKSALTVTERTAK